RVRAQAVGQDPVGLPPDVAVSGAGRLHAPGLFGLVLGRGYGAVDLDNPRVAALAPEGLHTSIDDAEFESEPGPEQAMDAEPMLLAFNLQVGQLLSSRHGFLQGWCSVNDVYVTRRLREHAGLRGVRSPDSGTR